MDFIGSSAELLGYPKPSRYQRPTAYIKDLKRLVAQEQQRRTAEEERKRREAEISAGWVPCGCPAVHARFGKFRNGTLYHPANLRCPKWPLNLQRHRDCWFQRWRLCCHV